MNYKHLRSNVNRKVAWYSSMIFFFKMVFCFTMQLTYVDKLEYFYTNFDAWCARNPIFLIYARKWIKQYDPIAVS